MRVGYRFVFLLSALVLASCSPEEELAPGQNLGGITVRPPSAWRTQTPSSSMRKAQYSLPKQGNDTEDATLVIYYFGRGQGGSVEANLARWYGQFQQPDGRDSKDIARVTEKSISGMQVTIADLTGTYAPGAMGPMAPVPSPKEGFRMLAAIVESPQGAYYFKLTGSENTVGHWAESFDRFIEEVRAE